MGVFKIKGYIVIILFNRSSDGKLSLHQEKRRKRAAQLRYRGRPSSFDASFIVRCPNRKCVRSVAQVVTSKPNFLRRQRTLQWEMTSSSGCSSDSGSDFG